MTVGECFLCVTDTELATDLTLQYVDMYWHKHMRIIADWHWTWEKICPSLRICCSPHLRSFSSSSLPLKQSGLWSHNLMRNLYLNQCSLMTEREKETRQVAQPRKPEDLQKLLRLVQLAGEVTLQKRKGFFNIQSLTWQTIDQKYQGMKSPIFLTLSESFRVIWAWVKSLYVEPST